MSLLRHEWSCPTTYDESCDCAVMPASHRLALFWGRLKLWLSPRWPALPDDIHQSIDEQVRVRTDWVRNHRHDDGGAA